jgi:hypothetical protein
MHYETLRASYDGSRSLRRDTKVYDNDVYEERQPREANLFIFLNLNIKFGPSFKRKHSQVRVKYW